jgi:hypothetical protein
MCLHMVSEDSALSEKKEEKKNAGEDMSLPPVFPKRFYQRLADLAREFHTSRVAFAMKAIEHYGDELRKRKGIRSKALGAELAEKYGELTGRVMRRWWSTVPEKERTERGRRAAEARWAKKRAEEKKKKPEE